MGGSSSKAKASKAKSGGHAKQKKAPEPALKVPLTQRKHKDLQIGMFSDPGFGSDEEENQDVCMISTLNEGGEPLNVCALFDGHGHEGRAIADMAKRGVLAAVTKHRSENLEGLKKSFTDLHADIISSSDVDVSQSGVSATVAIFDNSSHRLLIANVGDTKAVLGRGIRLHSVKQLTEDHYPTVEHERRRIEAAGGRVAASDDVQLGELGEMRIWKGHTGAPGLALSRTIGDAMAKEVGVVCEPSVTEVILQPEDRFLVLASAGVWKVFSPQEIVDLVAEQADANAAVNAVVEEATKRWEELWQGENTTVVVFVFPNDPEWQ